MANTTISLTLEEARALSRDLWAVATEEVFQSKLKEIHEKGRGQKTLKTLALVREVQEQVLPKYGFEASAAGVAEMQKVAKTFEYDFTFMWNSALSEMALGVVKLWKVVGGAEKGGIMVRQGEDTKSPEEVSRLSTGALVQEVQLKGDRLEFKRRAGAGPDGGWVSIKLKANTLLERVDVGNAQIVDEETRPQVEPVAGPQYPQAQGKPFTFYHQVQFADTKPTGLRMSACFVAMDENRIDLLSACDMSAKLLQVTGPHIQMSLELTPAMTEISKDPGHGGIAFPHPDSRGIVTSWLRTEQRMAFPRFPFKVEEQRIFFMGKEGPRSLQENKKEVYLGTLRSFGGFVDENTGKLCDEDIFSKELDLFYAKVKDAYFSDHLNVSQLSSLYPERGTPFVPTVFQKVVWKMSYSFSDCWSRLFHAKIPELVWELNDLAGGPFAKMVEREPDPQAVVINLAKQMDLGTIFEVMCFLDEAGKSAVYLLYPEGSKNVSDLSLAVRAHYDWAGAPKDGKSLCKEDLELTEGPGPVIFHKYVFQQKVVATKLADLTKLTT